jgi:hypothetical protein
MAANSFGTSMPDLVGGNGIRGGWMDGFVTAWCDAVKSKEFAWDKVPSPKCHLLLLLLASSPIFDQEKCHLTNYYFFSENRILSSIKFNF